MPLVVVGSFTPFDFHAVPLGQVFVFSRVAATDDMIAGTIGAWAGAFVAAMRSRRRGLEF